MPRTHRPAERYSVLAAARSLASEGTYVRNITDKKDVFRLNDSTTNSFWRSVLSVPVLRTLTGWVMFNEIPMWNYSKNGKSFNNGIRCSQQRQSFRYLPNWKSPRTDGLHFWLKWLTSSHTRLASQFQLPILRVWVATTVSNIWCYPPTP